MKVKNLNLLFISGNMIYWVVYDIKNNSRRLKVSEECKNFGMERVQKSVFIGIITKNQAEMLAIKCKELVDRDDCVFIIATCNNCFSNKIIIGDFDEEKVKKMNFVVVN